MKALSKQFYLPRFKEKIRFTRKIPQTFVDNFQVYEYHQFSLLSSFLFLITVFFLPIFYDLLVKYVISVGSSISLGFLALKFIGYGLSFGWFLYEDTKKFIKSGAWAIYLFLFSQIITIIIVSIATVISGFTGAIDVTNDKTLSGSIALLIQGLVQIGVIILILILCKPLMLKIFNTITYNILLVVLTLIFAYGIMYGLNYLSSLINIAINGKNSAGANQTTIEASIRTIFDKVLVFIPIVIAAPIIEELAFRHGFMMLTRNRWIGAVGATILFAWVHVVQNPENFFVYFGISVALTSVFIVSRENVTYAILLHMINNFVAYIFLVSR